jgi:cystathionine beta-synthase
MNEYGVTLIPVIENNQSIGSLRESRVLTKLLENRDLLEAKVSDVMDESFPIVEMDASFNEIKAHLQKSPAVLIEDFKRITGIITRTDMFDLQK